MLLRPPSAFRVAALLLLAMLPLAAEAGEAPRSPWKTAKLQQALLTAGSRRAAGIPEEDALPLAAALGDTDAIASLVREGFAVDGKGSSGESALFVAAAAGRLAAVDALLAAGADPALVVESRRAPEWTPLFVATLHGHDDIVQRLLSLPGAKQLANARDRYRRNALFYAALHGQLAIARLLVDAGADCGGPNIDCAEFAAMLEREELEKMLRAAEAEAPRAGELP